MAQLICDSIKLLSDDDGRRLVATIKPYGDWENLPEGKNALETLVKLLHSDQNFKGCNATLVTTYAADNMHKELEHFIRLVYECDSIEALMYQRAHLLDDINEHLKEKIMLHQSLKPRGI